ncbi:hypothetical protein PUW79_11890 [Microbacterium sp. NE2HP2]|uniref:hypothetical protein n=1 Tax=Microbacterium plantarum TaxID=1816425 RepID=UPI0023659AB7|nr:hypothetical protein [Microbacterium plantarum]MDD7945334.1 hypothetical protein [Microbacterium plantarum]
MPATSRSSISRTPMNNRHIIITGDASDDFRATAASLRLNGVTVTIGSYTDSSDDIPVTSFLIVARFAPGMEWGTWWERDAHNRDAFETVLPHLAPSSNGILLGLSATTVRSERAEIRAGMGSLLHRFQARAAERGIDFSMNGIELPVGYDQDLLGRRLSEHAARRSVLANEAIVRFEDLTGQTIAQAMTTDFI